MESGSIGIGGSEGGGALSTQSRGMEPTEFPRGFTVSCTSAIARRATLVGCSSGPTFGFSIPDPRTASKSRRASATFERLSGPYAAERATPIGFSPSGPDEDELRSLEFRVRKP